MNIQAEVLPLFYLFLFFFFFFFFLIFLFFFFFFLLAPWQCRIPYMLTGSLASSLYAERAGSIDFDLLSSRMRRTSGHSWSA